MSRARLSEETLRWISCFNGNIRLLVGDLAARCPTDPMVGRIQKRIALAIDADPLFVLRLTGPCLYKYEKQIYAGDVRFFLENEYEEEFKASENKERTDAVLYLMPKVKELARGLPTDEKKKYIAIIAEMLDAYLEVETSLRRL